MDPLKPHQKIPFDFHTSRTGMSKDMVKQSFLEHLFYTQARLPAVATLNDQYLALAYTVRDRLVHRWMTTVRNLVENSGRVVCYFSAEFLLGPHLGNNLINLGIYDETRQAMEELGLNLDTLIEHEEEPGLGNGGLGRLAACFMDSLATLEVPAIGYGIRYEFGIFDQRIRDGWQVEMTDTWLSFGNPWEIPRPELSQEVAFGGRTEAYEDEEGCFRVCWIPDRAVRGVPCDTPIPGYGVGTCNLLRLWKAEAVKSFDFQAFNIGDYYDAVQEKVISETISKVLYPNDEPARGKILRLAQQYFFVSCALKDMIRLHLLMHPTLENFHERFAAQLNDTHPSIGVAELMRLLVDEHRMDWDKSWDITRKTFAYTNHTLLPEALEKWSLPMFASLLPRHLEIIYEINRRFLDQVRALYPGDDQRMSRMSLIDESGERFVRMAHLASVGSHAINGVAALHSELLKQGVLRDFFELYPERFHNVTNGVTLRRWMLLANPKLAGLITQRIGDEWVRHPEKHLKRLEAFAEDPEFGEAWRRAKKENKISLASLIQKRTGITVDPESLFDILVKRFHEYKRQHLKLLHIITLFNEIKRNPGIELQPRTFIFGGKAAPGYFMAKLIIKLINSVAEVINADPDVKDRLKIVFFPDFNVKNGQHIYPAADLSEQISTAGKEASGTGNMKFSMNGALTIGTLDGANVEIRDEVGAENFFLFGLTADEVSGLKTKGYRPVDFYESDPQLKEVIDLIGSGFFSNGDGSLFKPLIDSILHHDEYMLLADYRPYVECQKKVDAAYGDSKLWTRMSILNVARMGKFSSDRSIRDYCTNIWKTRPVPSTAKEQLLKK